MKRRIVPRGMLTLGLTVLLLAVSASGASAEESLDPTSASFGNGQVGTTSPPKAFTLTVDCFDAGGINCTSYSFSPNIFVRGRDPDHFVQTNNCPALMQVDPFEEEGCTINVTFKPLSTGSKEAILYTGSGGPAAELTGNGVSPPDGLPPPPDGGPGPAPLTLDLEAKKQKLRKKLKFFATASVASTLVAEDKKIKETTEQLAANQETKVKAKLKRKARNRLEEKLEEKGKAKVKIEATATTQSGAEATDTVKVKLKD